MEIWRVAWGPKEGWQSNAVHLETERWARAVWESRIQSARNGLLWNARYVWLMRVSIAPFLSGMMAEGCIREGNVCDLLNHSNAVLSAEVVDVCEIAGDDAIVHN